MSIHSFLQNSIQKNFPVHQRMLQDKPKQAFISGLVSGLVRIIVVITIFGIIFPKVGLYEKIYLKVGGIILAIFVVSAIVLFVFWVFLDFYCAYLAYKRLKGKSLN